MIRNWLRKLFDLPDRTVVETKRHWQEQWRDDGHVRGYRYTHDKNARRLELVKRDAVLLRPPSAE